MLSVYCKLEVEVTSSMFCGITVFKLLKIELIKIIESNVSTPEDFSVPLFLVFLGVVGDRI